MYVKNDIMKFTNATFEIKIWEMYIVTHTIHIHSTKMSKLLSPQKFVIMDFIIEFVPYN